jgi:hypothetical protein
MKIGYVRQGETKELRWTKRAKKIEKHAQWSTLGQGLSVPKDLKPARPSNDAGEAAPFQPLTSSASSFDLLGTE